MAATSLAVQMRNTAKYAPENTDLVTIRTGVCSGERLGGDDRPTCGTAPSFSVFLT